MKKDVYELTNPQKSIWYMEETYSGSSINNVCGSLTINEKLDFVKFEKAINLFLKYNDSLRIRLCLDGFVPKQYFCEHEDINFEIIDVTDESDMYNVTKNMALTPFKVIDSPLFDFKLFKYPKGNGGLIANFHHLISDAASLAIIGSGIVSIYSKLKNNEDISNNDISSYIDFILSEREYLSSDKFIKDEKFWNDMFETVPDVASIPSSFKGSTNYSSHSKRKSFVLSSDFIENIRELCQKERISAYNFFMAIFALYIGRVSNLDEFVIGTPLLNRSNFKEKHTPGMFINNVPFKINIDNSKSFLEFVTNIAKDSLSALRHQKYPYQYLLENLRKKLGNVPNLYDALFSYQITKTVDKSIDIPYSVEWVEAEDISCGINIHIHDNNDSGLLSLSYDYLVDKYSEEDILAIHNRFLHIIEQVINNVNIAMKDIDIVTFDEKNRILYEFNNTKADYEKDKSIIQLFEEQVNNNPNKIALVSNKFSISYDELNRLSNKLANHLLSHGVTDKSIIGILVNRSPEMIIGLLAILKCGATYLPLDPEYPKDRISYILDNSKSQFLLINDNTINLVSDKYSKINISLPLIKSLVCNEDNINKCINPDNLIYLIYTSGTTGNPKGVMVTYNNVLNFISAMKKVISFSSDKVMVSVTTICFDIFGLEVWCSLTSGMTLVLANEQEQNLSEKLNSLCIDNNVNMIQTTPSRYLNFISDKQNLDFLSNMTDILVGGEGIPVNLLEYFHKNLNCNIFNMYGPTETTIWSTIKDLSNTDKISIGKPILNTDCYILGKNQSILPFGTPGTLFIGGLGVTKGYYNNKTLTDEKFIHSPFKNDEIIYNTNDLAYWSKDGEIIHLGRNDFQIKLHGYRVDLSEIESTIEAFPNIEKSVVKYDSLSKKLYAFYKSKSNIDNNDLKLFLLKKLPTYMIPYQFVKIDVFPYTPNGKLDRKALVLPDNIKNITSEFVKPKSDTEKTLYDIIKSVANIDDFSLSEDIFSLGLDSIGVLNLSIKIEDVFDKNISAKQIYGCSSIIELSKLIDSIEKSNNQKLLSKPIDYNKNYPLSSAQKRVYYATKMAGNDNCLYNMPGCIILNKKPDINKLNKCFGVLIQRHSSLRTHFELVDNEVFQKVSSHITFKVDEIVTKKENIDGIIKEFVKPFDLEKAPLLRVCLVNQKDKWLLLFDMHHIISDGLSLSILTNELSKLYNNEDLPKLTANYTDYVNFEEASLTNGNLDDSKKYWINQFNNNIPVLDLPTNYPRPNTLSFEGAKVYKTISSDLGENIQSLAKQLNVSTYMLLLSAYYILLYKYSNQEDIIVGTPVIGRNKDELLNIIGMFVNYLPLRTHINADISFNDFLSNVKSNCINSFNHQEYPYDNLISSLNIPRNNARNPLFDTMFIYQNNSLAPLSFDGVPSSYYIPDTNISKLDLSLEVIPMEDSKFKLNFEFCTKLFSKEFMQDFSDHYINLLNSILQNPNEKISNVSMLSEKEEDYIINKFNDTLLEYPYDKTIIEVFEEQVKKTPNNIAVICNNNSISYSELNKRANQVAYYLRSEGVRPNQIIGILINRSIELFICILGILKSGGAYVPIDPTYPKERIDYIIKDSCINILLTSSVLSTTVSNVKAVVTDINNSPIYNLPSDNLDIVNFPSDLAYLIYTSGSTGKPKGATIKHYNVNNLVKAITSKIKFEGNIVSVNTFCFDMFVLETFLPLQTGLGIVLANEQEQNLPQLLNKICVKNNVTMLQTTPTRMSLLLSDKNSLDYLSKLKVLMIGGEPFPASLLSKLKQLTSAKIYNMYGPTETTVWSSLKDITNTSNITIGKPIGNTSFYILDKNLNLLPPYIPGELYIGGDGVGKGYFHREKLTHKKFIVNPYNELETIYNTGDVAKWTSDGEIICMGRSDFQVKIRGLRIELEEIENKILKFPNIQKAVVCVKQDNLGRDFLCAYYVSNDRIKTPELKKHLSQFLPMYMVPNKFMQLPDLKYTPNGKIDRKALPDIEFSVESNDIVLASTPTEIKLSKLFEDLLGISPISITDNFFEIGGDSMLALKLQIALLSDNINVTYADIFKYNTISLLANKIDSMENSPTTTDYSQYDFSDIDNLLKNNSISSLENISMTPIGNVILAGATGFLGSHILASILEHTNAKVYCLLRPDLSIDINTKLLTRLNYYFGNKYDSLLNTRIFAISSDITKKNFDLNSETLEMLVKNTSCVINSAAIVKHYGDYSDFEEINVNAVRNLIDFCNTYNKKLVQISTISVSGNLVFDVATQNKLLNNDVDFTETNLYIGQSLENVYIRSKFEAEKLIFENIIHNNLNAIVLRVGNITNRSTDGKFQINKDENAFANRLKAFMKLKAIPNYLRNSYAEFSPVDNTSDAILKAIQYANGINVLHLYNSNHVYLNDLVDLLPEGMIQFIDDEVFDKKLKNSLLNSNITSISSLVNDLDENQHLVYDSKIKIKNNFTNMFLDKIDFHWSKIDREYIEKLLKNI